MLSRKGLKKGTPEMAQYMQQLRDRKKNKKVGKGFVTDNILKPVGRMLIDETTNLLPLPEFVKSGVKAGAKTLVGLGMKKKGMKKGGALMPPGY